MQKPSIQHIVISQRAFFKTGQTKSVSFRIVQLQKLKSLIITNEKAILKALHDDFKKPETEAYLSEIYSTLHELDVTLKNLKKWIRPQRVSVPLLHIPGSSYIYQEPYGVTTIIAPWNYPVSLLLVPAIGAIAAGNTVILKPSEFVENTSALLTKLIREQFSAEYIAVIEGGKEETVELLNERLDYIFFTGSTQVGRHIMQQAAKHLTPVTLELGGKSPCIVDEDVDLKTAVRRIVWGKFFNAGQTCIAPDYVLVNKKIKHKFLELVQLQLVEFFGNDPKQSKDFARIVNHLHFERLQKMLTGTIVAGGEIDASQNYIAPTIITDLDVTTHPAMLEEIFGPILPVIEYSTLDEAIDFINARPKPLSLYVFSNNKDAQEKVVHQTSSGGVCINDVVVQFATINLPFGGVGESGLGNYHGKATFECFSHKKSVLKKSFLIDPKIRYAPYTTSLNLIKKLMKWFG